MKLTIPTPCHENWDQMSPAEQGRFCSVCSKTVQDFTAVPDEGIVDAFSQNSEDTCGRFTTSQLNRDLQFSFINSLFAKFAVGFILTAGGFTAVKAQQCEPKRDSIPEGVTKGNVESVVVKDSVKTRNIVLGGIHSKSIRTNVPLYVVDGKVISEKRFRKIDTQNIESVRIIKDEPAIIAYGRKAKNGVIVVTTKVKR
ncbi:TonB-dependent receptor plug domain-containing protein [Chryseobacterium profundimaris]|uniref:TonB-dependent Receptor Plug Domain n=1 Tax=Chryseobacterium profundimaris TaxID=1387275 RepID=A0ABY1P1K6_9FLAO|nr:TonB-dependent receptor plug domain-containing protein [Chryseobacterium profundimaris]SMP23431.1 TonB-dependent Receptor Plug Domain [Chryseobacterium profundimaris]